jgi:3-hydroxyisobutyrate dehydrogenase
VEALADAPDKPVVAFLGTGIMGFPMARRAMRAGLDVRAWNRTLEKAGPLADDGATVSSSPAEAVDGVDLIVTMLSDADAVVSVMEGEHGGLAAARDGAVWAQMSTIGIEGAERCLELAEHRGIDMVDAPVLGTRQPAENGELVVLASGPDAARDRCQPLFDAVGQRTMRLGAAGEGTRLKLVVNSWIVSVVEGLAETIALAQGVGLDPQLFLEAIGGGGLDMPYARMKGTAMIEQSFEPSFPLRLAAKDADLVVQAAQRHGLDLPALRAIAERMAQGVEAGHGDEDLAATYRTSAPPPA